jgi:hypothetical protein
VGGVDRGVYDGRREMIVRGRRRREDMVVGGDEDGWC